MLKDGMLYSRYGRSTSGVECTNPGCQDALASARLAAVTAERDSLKHAVEQAERALMEIGACSCEIGTDVERLVHAHRCALLAKEQAIDKLAALKKRLADAVKSHAVSPWGGLSKGYAVGARTVDKPGRYALVRLEDGE